MYWCFSCFPSCNWFLVSHCCGQKKMFEIISILLNLLRLVLWPNMWSIVENVPCALEKNVYSGFFGCNVLKMSVKSNCPIVSFRISVALLIFGLGDLSINVSRMLKSPTIIVFPSISPFISVVLCIWGLLYWVHICWWV